MKSMARTILERLGVRRFVQKPCPPRDRSLREWNALAGRREYPILNYDEEALAREALEVVDTWTMCS